MAPILIRVNALYSHGPEDIVQVHLGDLGKKLSRERSGQSVSC